MTDDNTEDFLVLRDLDEPISRDALDEAAARSGEVLDALREEGTAIHWVDSEVLTDADDQVLGTLCHYQAPDEAAIREHGERAGLPVTRVSRRGTPLAGEE